MAKKRKRVNIRKLEKNLAKMIPKGNPIKEREELVKKLEGIEKGLETQRKSMIRSQKVEEELMELRENLERKRKQRGQDYETKWWIKNIGMVGKVARDRLPRRTMGSVLTEIESLTTQRDAVEEQIKRLREGKTVDTDKLKKKGIKTTAEEIEKINEVTEQHQEIAKRIEELKKTEVVDKEWS